MGSQCPSDTFVHRGHRALAIQGSNPPSTRTGEPVINLAPSETRKRATRAISSGRPAFPSGCAADAIVDACDINLEWVQPPAPPLPETHAPATTPHAAG